MKILRKGKGLSRKQATVLCAACGCKFRFAANEGKYVNDPRDGDYISIKCPGCKTGHNVATTLFCHNPP